ncbi:hypothetical protein ABPG75_010343 [Micractinium tetrahymenae]
MSETGPGGSPQRPIKPSEGRPKAEAASSTSTDSTAFKADPPAAAGGSHAQPATTRPHLTGRRSRSDSPKSEGGVDEQPLKRQNSMGTDDPAIGPPQGGAQPMEEAAGAAVPSPSSPAAAATAASPPGQAAGQPPPLHQLQQQRQQQSQSPRAQAQQQGQPPRPGQPGSPAHPSVAHACPPFGSKSVIGRRAKMEDACVAVPFLVEVPVSRAGMDELLPPRIAPQLRSTSASSGASEQTAAIAAAAVAAASAGSGSGGAGTSSGGVGSIGGIGSSGGEGATAMSVDAQHSSSERLGQIATETLHFFGVFDGHGGADAALHCAKSLHERVREVLSACAVGPDLLTLRSKDGGGSGPSAGSPRAGGGVADAPQASSSSGTGQQHASSSSGHDDASSSRPQHAASASGTEYQDAAETGDLNSSSSAGSYLDADFDEDPAGASNSVQGVSCTAETIEAALTKAFHITDEEFGNMGGYEHLALVGTTAVVALVGSRMIYVANCGDSRAVLCRSGGALPLTDDHKAAREDETARVEAAGGQILFWNGVRVMGLLAVSRAIGDHSLRPYVIAEPEVTIVARHPSDEVLVMASDGLWDVMSNQEAVTLAKKCLGRARSRGSTRQSAARVAATVLTRAAVDRGSRDNVTVVIVDLSPMTQAEIEAEAQLSERSETVPDVSAQRQQRAPQQPPSAVAVRSSREAAASLSHPPPPPVQASPFAASAALPMPMGASSAPAKAASPLAEPAPPAEGDSAHGGEAAGVRSASRPPAAALVSPFSSGALPVGLDFDVQQHASAVAAAAAAAAPQPPPVQQTGRRKGP